MSPLWFGCTLYELFSFRIPRSGGIDNDVFRIARRPTEEVEDGHPVTRMRLGERIARYPDLPYFRQTSEPGYLCRVRELVIAEI
jgi:hypothetical protein